MWCNDYINLCMNNMVQPRMISLLLFLVCKILHRVHYQGFLLITKLNMDTLIIQELNDFDKNTDNTRKLTFNDFNENIDRLIPVWITHVKLGSHFDKKLTNLPLGIRNVYLNHNYNKDISFLYDRGVIINRHGY